MSTKIKIKKLTETAKIPTLGSAKSTGCDLYADIKEMITIMPGKTAKIPTGLAIAPPEGYFGAIFPRSGLATKQGLRLANSTGICDNDFRGNYTVVLYNDSDLPRVIEPQERIAQLAFLPYLPAEFELTDELDETERGDGGFGSTGMN